MAGNPQGSKRVQNDENTRASNAPQPSQEHLKVEQEEKRGRPPRSGARAGRTEVSVTSHEGKDGADGVVSPEEKAGR